MHRAGPASHPLFLTLLLVLAGCVADSRMEQAPVKTIFVREPADTFAGQLKTCGEAAHDAAVRRLRALGYVAATDETQADAFLDGAWELTPGAPDDLRRRVTLRLVIRSRQGTELFSCSVAEGTMLSFLSRDRIGDEVGDKLSALGEAPFAR
jgi:hypothetical protein